MIGDEQQQLDANATIQKLDVPPPYIWPDNRIMAGQMEYESLPPFDSMLFEASLIGGVIVGVDDDSIKLIAQLLHENPDCRLKLIFTVYPACPTRTRHLEALKSLQELYLDPDAPCRAEFKVLPVMRSYGEDFEQMTLVPTVIEAIDGERERTMLCIGSNANLGMDQSRMGYFNTVFEANERHRDSFRKWFAYLWGHATRLNDQSINIPHLVPAEGDSESARKWAEFMVTCHENIPSAERTVTVDPETGEVVPDPDDRLAEEWDCGETKLNPLAQMIQEVYSKGYLVTVDETTRIKPLTVPVKAALLGQEPERTFGAVRRRQTFSLEILTSDTAKQIEKYRKVSGLIRLLSYSISTGNHWIPEEAKPLLDKELEEENKQAAEVLKAQLGDGTIEDFIKQNAPRFRQDLNYMYRDLGLTGEVPDGAFDEIMDKVRDRLEKALGGRITPQVSYNRISSPPLSDAEATENWSQPFRLLLEAAQRMRESLTNSYFSRNFSKRSFDEKAYVRAMNVFDDAVLKSSNQRQAQEEQDMLVDIEAEECDAMQKCEKVFKIVSGTPSEVVA